MELVEAGEKPALELVAEDKDWDEERSFGKTVFSVRSDAIAGNDIVL